MSLGRAELDPLLLEPGGASLEGAQALREDVRRVARHGAERVPGLLLGDAQLRELLVRVREPGRERLDELEEPEREVAPARRAGEVGPDELVAEHEGRELERVARGGRRLERHVLGARVRDDHEARLGLPGDLGVLLG